MSSTSSADRRMRRGRSAPKRSERWKTSRTPRDEIAAQAPFMAINRLTDEMRQLVVAVQAIKTRQDELERQANAVANQLSADQRALAAHAQEAVQNVANTTKQEILNTQQGTEQAIGDLAEAARTEFRRAGAAISHLSGARRRDESPETPPMPTRLTPQPRPDFELSN